MSYLSKFLIFGHDDEPLPEVRLAFERHDDESWIALRFGARQEVILFAPLESLLEVIDGLVAQLPAVAEAIETAQAEDAIAAAMSPSLFTSVPA